MTQEKLKLVLDALENGDVPTPKNAGKNLDAITVIKEALAQEQEPVAWAHYDTFNNLNSLTTARFKATLATKNTGACCIALYITPPRRTWVGLTDEDISKISQSLGIDHDDSWTDLKQAIEAKLKEKNT
jgi:hypothetical protein